MTNDFYVDFSGSLVISVAEDATMDDVRNKFFDIINSYNATHDPQFVFCEIDGIEAKN